AFASAEPETFGITPSVPPDERWPESQQQFDQSLPLLPPGPRYIAIRTKCCPPLLPVQTKEEKQLFSNAVQHFESPLSWDNIAEDWNNGKVMIRAGIKKSVPPKAGNNIFWKDAGELERNHRTYLDLMDKRLARQTVGSDLMNLREEHLATRESDSLLELDIIGQPEPLPYPISAFNEEPLLPAAISSVVLTRIDEPRPTIIGPLGSTMFTTIGNAI
ncbi:hypothetical protein HDU76_012290, partial [Blyttiomyces sp. JEL0837]